ncbi:hypothetical protein P4O66_021572 [Electrophorus voltai]|uniref:Uncharacterized protein n=1 Tax=Electrophorus voltai TaxID=2609070 RepID=A0AAD8ZQG0_9TELE|nr:hypothetical protein P4O66_021572 [Electrophorus voltai]
MHFHFEAQLLVVLVVVLLTSSVSEGRELEECELRDELNATLPANVLDFIGLSKIVCIFELNSGLNTSAIHHITVRSDGDDTSSESGLAGPQRKSAHESNSEESDEKNQPDFGSSTAMPTTTPQGNYWCRIGHRSLRWYRSAHGSRKKTFARGHSQHGSESAHSSSSEESDAAEMSMSAVTISATSRPPVTGTPFNVSTSAAVLPIHRPAHQKKAEEWKLYGLFQLPDHIACSSGNQRSLNLCNMTCDNYSYFSMSNYDQNISMFCVMIRFSSGKQQGSFKELFQKLHSVWQLNNCDDVVDFQYFSNC